MINFLKYKAILWDFDGVLIDSMSIRDAGFSKVLSAYPSSDVEQLLNYHHKNGGLSRYVKFRYFLEQIRKERVEEQAIHQLADEFSQVMRNELTNPALLIGEAVEFVKKNLNQYRMHVVSGSDENELKFLCAELGIAGYFISIHGSPTPKEKLVADLLAKEQYNREEVVLIGDSRNDLEAAVAHTIDFLGYNNNELAVLGTGYIDSFKNL